MGEEKVIAKERYPWCRNSCQKTIFALLIFVSVLFSMPQQADAISPGVDVFGLKLGMTSEEAVKALHQYDPNLILDELRSSITINDSQGRDIIVAPFLLHISAKSPPNQSAGAEIGAGEVIFIVFSLPPAEERVRLIRRYAKYEPNKRPSLDTFKADLVKKYGKPANLKNGKAITQLWLFDRPDPLKRKEFKQWRIRSRIHETSILWLMEAPSLIADSSSLGIHIAHDDDKITWTTTILAESKNNQDRNLVQVQRFAREVLERHEGK
jgi:hypothetical protein